MAIAGFNPDLSNVWANQVQYGSPQLAAMAEMFARLLGAPSVDALPPMWRDIVQKGLYIASNNWGDQLGILNSGNLFMNMQQSVMAGALGGGFSSMNGGYMGMTPGSQSQLMNSANLLTQAAHQFYFTPGGGVNYSNTHGMNPMTFAPFAADVARYVPLQTGGAQNLEASVRGGRGSLARARSAFNDLEGKGVRFSPQQTLLRDQLDTWGEFRRDQRKMRNEVDKELDTLEKSLSHLETPQEKDNWRRRLNELARTRGGLDIAPHKSNADALKFAREQLNKKDLVLRDDKGEYKKYHGSRTGEDYTYDTLTDWKELGDTYSDMNKTDSIRDMLKKGTDIRGKNPNQDGLIRMSVQGKQGSAGIEEMLKQALEAGADRNSEKIRGLAELGVKVKRYEDLQHQVESEMMKQTPGVISLSEQDAKINDLQKLTWEDYAKNKEKYNSVFGGEVSQDMFEDMKKGVLTQMRAYRDKQREKVDKEVEDRITRDPIEAQKFGGVDVDEQRVSKDEIKGIAQASKQKNFEGTALSEAFNNRYQAAMNATARNVEQLSRLFGTTDYSQISALAQQLGMGSVADPRNAQEVADRITGIKAFSRMSGRDTSSVINEQGAITEFFRQIFGSKERVSGSLIEGVQNIGELADVHRRVTGHGPTRNEAVGGAVEAVAGFLDEKGSSLAVARVAADDENIPMSNENRAELKQLLENVDNANTQEEKDKALREVKRFTRRHGLMRYKNYVKDAGAKEGLGVAQSRAGEVIEHNALLHIRNMSPEERSDYSAEAQALFRATASGADKTLSDIIGQNGVDKEFMDKTMGDVSKEDAEKLIQENVINPMRAQGASQKEIARAAENYRKWMNLPSDVKKFIMREIDNSPAGSVYTSKAQQARLAQIKAKQQWEDRQNAEGGSSQGTIMDFINGLAGVGDNGNVTNRDLMKSQMAEWVKEQTQGMNKEEKEKWMEENVGKDGALTERGLDNFNKSQDKMKTFKLNSEGKIENTDFLRQTINTPQGKQFMWQAMGFSSLREAMKASGETTWNKAFQALENNGLVTSDLGNGQYGVTGAAELEKMRKEAQGKLDTQEKQDRITNWLEEKGYKEVNFDENGKIKSMVDKNGKSLTGNDLQNTLEELSNKNADFANMMSKNSSDDRLRAGIRAMTGGSFNEAFEPDIKDYTPWDKLSDKEKKAYEEAGVNEDTYNLRRTMMHNSIAAMNKLSDPEKKSFLTEVNKLAGENTLYEGMKRKKGESDEDYMKRIRSEGPTPMILEALMKDGVLREGTAASKAAADVNKFLSGGFAGEGGKVKIKDYIQGGKEQEIDMGNVAKEVKGSGGGGAGGGEGITSGSLLDILNPIINSLQSLASTVSGNSLRVNSREQ